MKRITALLIMLTLFVCSITPFNIEVHGAGELPEFFSNANYVGSSVSLDVGKYTLSDIQARGILDNDITAIKVPRGYRVIIFDGSNLDGESVAFTEDVANLTDVKFQNLSNWNDKLSSIEVCRIETGLLARYYGNMDLTDLVAQRVDPVINFNSVQDFKCPAVYGDTFSVRWSGEIQPLYTGTYTFYTTSDEGVKLTIDNKTVVDNWIEHTSTVDSGNIALTAGTKYKIDIIYYQKHGNANMKLEWYCPAGQAREVVPTERLYPESTLKGGEVNGLKAVYYQEKNFTSPVFKRIDQKIDFNWQNQSPHSLIDNNAFSVVWEAEIVPKYNGTYNFYTTSNDGVKLTIGNTVVIDRLVDNPGINAGAMQLNAGQRYNIKLQYYDNEGEANVKLEWECSAGQIREVIQPDCFITKSGTGLNAQYYDTEDRMPSTFYDYDCFVVRNDPNINFNWTSSSVDPDTADCRRIMRWNGKLEATYSGLYTFYIPSNGGVQFSIGTGAGAPGASAYIDHWVEEGQYEASVEYNLQAGRTYNISLEFFGRESVKNIKLEWSCPGMISRQVIPSGNLYPTLNEYNGTFFKIPTGLPVNRNSEFTYSIQGCLDYFNGNRILQDKLLEKALDVWESATRFKFKRVETGGEIEFIVEDHNSGDEIAIESGGNVTFYNNNSNGRISWSDERYYVTAIHEVGHVLGLPDLRTPNLVHTTDPLYNAQLDFEPPTFDYYALNHSIMDYLSRKMYPYLSEYDIAFVQGAYGAPEHKPLINVYIDTNSSGTAIHDTLATSSWPEANRIPRENGGDSKVTELLGTMPIKPMPDTKPLYRYKRSIPGKIDYIVDTSTSVASNFTFDGYLGEIYKTAGGDRIPLYRFYNSVEQDYTITTCDLSYDTRYKYKMILGYIDSLSTTTWVDDEFPQNADIRQADQFYWSYGNPTPYSGIKAQQSITAAGIHQHYFVFAPQVMEVGKGQTLFCYIYIDPANVPETVMLQWYDGSWDHRAYWGANNIPWGTDNTASRRYMGPLPDTGGWVRLDVPASLVGLEGRAVNGMAYALCGGTATWDKAGVCN